MVPLYAARVSDLGTDDILRIDCACGHIAELTLLNLKTAGIPPESKVLDLQRQLKCQSCRWRGRAVVSIRWSSNLLSQHERR